MNIGAAQKTETLTTSGMNIGAWQEEVVVGGETILTGVTYMES